MENERACEGQRITLRSPYREKGSASASRYATKTRDTFTRLLGDLDRNRFGADVLVLWESSRGSRSVGEWVRLIELCEARGVAIFVTTHAREYNPANPRDRRSLLEDAIDAEYESGKISQRAKRAAAANVVAGRPHGAVPYGYQRRYDERTRVMVAQEPHPTHAPMVRELYQRLLRGESLRSIAVEFERRGFRNGIGRPFVAAHLRVLVLRPTYAGLRTHRGKITGEGTWPALVDRETWQAVHDRLKAPERVTTRPGGARHLLSMIARCEPCGSPVSVTTRDGRGQQYQCHTKGCVRIDKAELDDLAEQVIIGFLSDPSEYGQVDATERDHADELKAIRADLAVKRAELDELRDAAAAFQVSVASVKRIEPPLVSAVEALEARERELTMPAALNGPIRPGPLAEVRRRWKDAPLSARRDTARMLLSFDLVGELRVARRPPRSNVRVPAVERVTLVGRKGTTRPG